MSPPPPGNIFQRVQIIRPDIKFRQLSTGEQFLYRLISPKYQIYIRNTDIMSFII